MDFRAAQDTCAIPKGIAQQRCLGLQLWHHPIAVRHVVMATILRIAINVVIFDQVAEKIESFDDFGMHALCDVEAPTFDPLRALQATSRNLCLTTVASRTTIGDTMCFENVRFDPELFCEVKRTGKTSVARPNDNNIHVHVRGDRAVVCRRRPSCTDPIGRCIVGPTANGFISHRVIVLIIWRTSAPRGDVLHRLIP